MTVFGFGSCLLQIRFSLFRSLMRIENRIKTTQKPLRVKRNMFANMIVRTCIRVAIGMYVDFFVNHGNPFFGVPIISQTADGNRFDNAR